VDAYYTLGKFDAINAIAGAFIVAFAATISVYLMTLARYPVSTFVMILKIERTLKIRGVL
jgi:hypothetical protein